MFEKSLFAQRLTGGSGIETLMEDLGHAMAEGGAGIRMLGGGNPALIPEVSACWRRRMRELLDEGARFDRMMAVYDPPKGNHRFALALAAFLQRAYGWDVGAEHIGITAGGQSAFFYLFNLLAGEFARGRRRRVLLPVVPEYIGYANQGLGADFFLGVMPEIEHTGPHAFKYRVDFARLKIGADLGAICVSRPTNPSGNVLTDAEIVHLDALAREAGGPLLIDNAYGEPFPGIVFTKIRPVWNENIILTFSLSKLGLPGTRTGIIVAHPDVIRAVTSMNTIVGLANGTIGQAIVTPLLESGEILELVRAHVRPFYERKAANARRWIAQYFDDALDYHVHASEGALFLWLWFRGLPISAAELYARLKFRGVLVVPGHFFAIGSAEAERHASECIRLSFAMDDAVVEEGIAILADEVARVYAGR
ncbi:MAG: valine--pyruvate transaminase [Terrimicrobiaceae bacterium]|nr:valine--pyruvate transaminase [Terrimicrobiaceae bacterium]